jgi:hypothetical protein
MLPAFEALAELRPVGGLGFVKQIIPCDGAATAAGGLF